MLPLPSPSSPLSYISLRADLDAKYMAAFASFAADLEAVQRLYERHKSAPPVPRNAPPVAGCIMWARHLLRRIQVHSSATSTCHTCPVPCLFTLLSPSLQKHPTASLSLFLGANGPLCHPPQAHGGQGEQESHPAVQQAGTGTAGV